MAFFHMNRLTQFAESDAAGIIHFSTVARYVEEAEHAFLTSAGFPIDLRHPQSLRWPRISYHANFTHPILPLQAVKICLSPLYVGRSSVNWKWSILSGEAESMMCEGEMKVVCCRLNQGKLEVIPLPEPLRARLTAGG